ncbi:MAG: hypothetical protein FWG16_04195, partial [Micrococcales bacterium]|nr:hypothetical protein [Micrococcales bacterium]
MAACDSPARSRLLPVVCLVVGTLALVGCSDSNKDVASLGQQELEGKAVGQRESAQALVRCLQG